LGFGDYLLAGEGVDRLAIAPETRGVCVRLPADVEKVLDAVIGVVNGPIHGISRRIKLVVRGT
jgi:hypothetical protein